MTGSGWPLDRMFAMRLGARVASADGYGTWTEAVAAARAASAATGGAIAICDDRGRLYLYTVLNGFPFASPMRMRARGENGYAFNGPDVRGLVDGALLATRGDCLDDWVPVPPDAGSRSAA